MGSWIVAKSPAASLNAAVIVACTQNVACTLAYVKWETCIASQLQANIIKAADRLRQPAVSLRASKRCRR
jgi:predicted transcriptional regulator